MSNEREAIEAVVNDYLQGMIYGQYDRLKGAMHPLCMQAGHYNGHYEFMPRDEFVEAIKPEPKLPVGADFPLTISMVDVTGDIAIVKLTDDCFGTTWTDYLTLIRHDEKWQIAMKAFYDHANDKAYNAQ
ncbi:nuclear transport factor 2 family protein [Aestuariivirga litoralis]|uniref:nuclear transport factor 2 family protein n=1 Tax=Aestuariivirga litoralis TaxID=2650924 RepID=UPI0018C5238B|nr:nuclear transport factor 2 family protein [Aestuariivirga litoralis]